jgi:hypothetical protein
MVKGGRVAKLVDHLRNADEFDSKVNTEYSNSLIYSCYSVLCFGRFIYY